LRLRLRVFRALLVVIVVAGEGKYAMGSKRVAKQRFCGGDGGSLQKSRNGI
jgi:hypothetical protein